MVRPDAKVNGTFGTQQVDGVLHQNFLHYTASTRNIIHNQEMTTVVVSYYRYQDYYNEYSYAKSYLSMCVCNWGPLWCYSCFGFEGMNRELKLLFHGSQDMTQQVLGLSLHTTQQILCYMHVFPQMAFSYVMMQTLPSLHTFALRPRVCNTLATISGKHQ